MFEIHLTTNTIDIESFKVDCNKVGLKPLLIELYGKYDTYQQVMTSSSYKNFDINKETSKAISDLSGLGYQISRVKVEVNPFTYNGDKEIIYLESHLRIKVNKNTEQLLSKLCIDNGFHKSKNAFKLIDGENYYMMATIREYHLDLNEFINKIDSFKKILIDNSLEFDKIEIEGCIIDTNVNLDNNWIKNK